MSYIEKLIYLLAKWSKLEMKLTTKLARPDHCLHLYENVQITTKIKPNSIHIYLPELVHQLNSQEPKNELGIETIETK